MHSGLKQLFKASYAFKKIKFNINGIYLIGNITETNCSVIYNKITNNFFRIGKHKLLDKLIVK